MVLAGVMACSWMPGLWFMLRGLSVGCGTVHGGDAETPRVQLSRTLPSSCKCFEGGPLCLSYRVLPDRQVKEVETFAQFGSIFLLFGHGLTYSTFMNTGRPSTNVYAPQVLCSYSFVSFPAL